MGNHKKYRIKSLYDNIMAVIIVLLLARRRTSFRVRLLLRDLRMQITQGISFRARAMAHRPSLISFVSSNWMVSRHRSRRRMIALQIFRDSFPRLIFLLRRQHRMPLFSRDSLTRSMRCITDFLTVLFRQLLFMAGHLSSLAVAITDADVAVTPFSTN